MREIDLAYIASAIDGEGSINLSERYKEGKYSYSQKINITNTNKNWLIQIKNSIQLGKIEVIKMYLRNAKDYYKLNFSKNESKILLPVILPYLRIKKYQAELMLKFIETYEIKYTRINRPPKEIIALRSAIVEEMKESNKKGQPNILS